MLIDSKGNQFNPKNLPKSRVEREAVLANLREVLTVPHKHGNMFHLGERAKMKGYNQ